MKRAWTAFTIFVGVFILVLIVLIVLVPHPPPLPPPTDAQKAATAARQARQQALDQAATAALEARNRAIDQERQYSKHLCRAAAACKKYDVVRLECATAGNFKTCLRIKMGEDADYSGACSGGNEGAPALPPPPDTPIRILCFLLTLSQ